MKKLLLLVAMVATFIGVSAQNPYAYKLTSEIMSWNVVKLSYSLNAPAQAVQIQLFDGENELSAIDMTDEMLTAGSHEYYLNFADYSIPSGKVVSWKVAVTGASVETPVEITDKVLKFYSPAGVAVDVNPESDNFGTIYVTESTAKNTSTYYTAPVNGAVGIGLYQFDPQLNGVKNGDGLYGFSCGMQSAGTTLVDWRPARMHISDDGRMFVLSQRVNTGYPLYEINRSTLQATPFFTGTLDTSTGIVTNGDVQVADGVGVAFDVMGSGENLKLMMMTCTPGTTTVTGNYKTNEYNIGTATSWGEAPSRNFTAFNGKAINYAGINLAYDGAGGIWMSQWRGAPTEGEPSYAYANLETDELQTLVTDIYSRNGGMAFNKDHTLMVRGEGYSKTLAVYAVNNGELTKLYDYSCPSFTGWNQFAFDYANNLIACDNSAEVFGMIQLPNSAAVVTPSAQAYNFLVPGSVADLEKMYLVGTFNGWSQEEGMIELVQDEEESVDYVCNVNLEAGAEFKVITPLGDGQWLWYGGVDENNVGYFLIKDNWFNDVYPVEIYLSDDGANLKMEEAGNYTIKVRKMIPTKGDRVNSMEQLAMFVTKNTVVAGDVNGDGDLTAADITALYTFLLSGDMSEIVNGDQDGDGEITTHDVTVVYDLILGGK